MVSDAMTSGQVCPPSVVVVSRHGDHEVYTTAGREEKRQYLRDLGVKYITSSRNGPLVVAVGGSLPGCIGGRPQGVECIRVYPLDLCHMIYRLFPSRCGCQHPTVPRLL